MNLKKVIDQLKNDYKKVSNDNFVENDWNLEGKKITINMNSFQKLMKDLTKKVDYVKISNIEDNKTKKIANKIELDLQNAKNNIEPMILAIKNKISTYANDFQKALETIDHAIAFMPQEANYYDTKGEILLMKGDEQEAVKMWQKVIELESDFLSKHDGETPFYKQLKEKGLVK